jgi:hypothetical protein
VKVRYFLTAADAVVLIEQDAIWVERRDHCPRRATGRRNQGGLFRGLQIEQCGCVTQWQHDALADFELTTIQR